MVYSMSVKRRTSRTFAVLAFAALAPSAVHAITVSIPQHADYVITLRNTHAYVATDLHIEWISGTKIKTATADNTIFTQAMVKPDGTQATFDQGVGGTGLDTHGTVNLRFKKSFATGSTFRILFSYFVAGTGTLYLNPELIPSTARHTETVAPVAVPAALGLLASALGGLGLFARRRRPV